jgi:hypothetical protein
MKPTKPKSNKPHSHQFRQDLISSILNELYEEWKGHSYKPEERAILDKVLEKTGFSRRTANDYAFTIKPKIDLMLRQS